MNASSTSPSTSGNKPPRRPGLVNALAILVALEAVGQGVSGLTSAVNGGSGALGGIIALLTFIFMGILLGLAWGLWQLKNWARIGLMVVIVIDFLLTLPQLLSFSPDNAGLTILIVVLALAFRGAIIYWLAANGKYFGTASNVGGSAPGVINSLPNPDGDASSVTGSAPNVISDPLNSSDSAAAGSRNAMDLSAVAANAAGRRSPLPRSTLVGLLVGSGVIGLLVCVGLGIFIYLSTRPIAKKVMTFGAGTGSGPGTVNEPISVGVDGSGNIVAADLKDGRVQIFNSGGTYVSGFTVNPGTGGLTEILGSAVSSDGKIYIAGLTSGIEVYDESGKYMGQIAEPIAGDGFLNAAVGPDGRLYALTGDSIVRFAQDGSVDLNVPISDTVNGTHLAVDGQGDVYVGGSDYDDIYEFSPSGTVLNHFSTNSTPSSTSAPTSIAVDAYGRVYVNNEGENIQIFDSTGRHLGDISGTYLTLALDSQGDLYAAGVYSIDAYQLQKPSGAAPATTIANSSSNSPFIATPTPVFASNTSNFAGTASSPVQTISVASNGKVVLGYVDGHVQTFDSSGNVLATIMMSRPSNYVALLMGQDGTLYALDSDGMIYVFDNTGKQVQTIRDGQNYYPHVALGPDGTLYATTSQGSIRHFTAAGKIAQEIPNATPDSHSLIAVDGSGNIYVAGFTIAEVMEFTPQGKPAGQISYNSPNGLGQPTKMWVDGYGRIYLNNTDGDIDVYDSTGSYLLSLHQMGDGNAFDPQGNIDSVGNDGRVYVFQVRPPS